MEIENRENTAFAEHGANAAQPGSPDDACKASRFDAPIDYQRRRTMEAVLNRHQANSPEMNSDAHAELHIVDSSAQSGGKNGATSWTVEGFYLELRRRGVVQAGTSYVVGSWVVAQVAELVSDIFGIPDWGLQALLTALAIGLPIALIIAWAFELTPDGLKLDNDLSPADPLARQPGRGAVIAIVALLVLVMSMLLVHREDSISNGLAQVRSANVVVGLESRAPLFFQPNSTILGRMPWYLGIQGKSRLSESDDQ